MEHPSTSIVDRRRKLRKAGHALRKERHTTLGLTHSKPSIAPGEPGLPARVRRRLVPALAVHAVAILRRAMGEDWRAALAYLERRYPGRWRRHTSTELTGRDGGPIQTEVATAIDLRNLTDEELRLLEEMSERAAPHED